MPFSTAGRSLQSKLLSGNVNIQFPQSKGKLREKVNIWKSQCFHGFCLKWIKTFFWLKKWNLYFDWDWRNFKMKIKWDFCCWPQKPRLTNLSLLVLISGLTTPMHQTHLQKETQKMKIPQHKWFERLSRFGFHHQCAFHSFNIYC